MNIRLSKDRGASKTSWLDSKHSFSFGDYYDPQHIQFGALRVINEDIVKPGSGFGEHSHRDMEILTYVLSGDLEHKDSMGNGSVIRPGSIQRMTAGTGVAHSEWNHSKSEYVHFLQIWVIPEKLGLPPGYEQKDSVNGSSDAWHVLASNRPSEAAVFLHQDLVLSHAALSKQQKLSFTIEEARMAWLQVISGDCNVNGASLAAGDSVTVEDSGTFEISTTASDARILWFNLGKV